jgi:uncharacterized membrane protein (DUF2068 family)
MSRRPVGLEAIILYKLIKAAVEVLLGIAAVILIAQGMEAGAATLAEVLLEHFTGGWALELATLIVVAATKDHAKFIAFAAFGDALLSVVEGLALRAGRWWAPWLVVIATAAFLPLELIEIFVHPRGGRFVILAINLAVVAYLLRIVARARSVRLATPPVDRPADGPWRP